MVQIVCARTHRWKYPRLGAQDPAVVDRGRAAIKHLAQQPDEVQAAAGKVLVRRRVKARRRGRAAPYRIQVHRVTRATASAAVVTAVIVPTRSSSERQS